MIFILIYCSHEYGGKTENVKKIEEKIKALQKENFDDTFISPVHAFGFMYEFLDYDTGMLLCLDLLSKCDKMLVLSKNISKGVQWEINEAERLNIPIEYEEVKNA